MKNKIVQIKHTSLLTPVKIVTNTVRIALDPVSMNAPNVLKIIISIIKHVMLQESVQIRQLNPKPLVICVMILARLV
jgi:hypothetical protein